MHIRHTARTTVTREELNRSGEFDGVALPSTPTGVQAAIDFGSALPKDRKVTLYHTYVERARETAEGIRRGVIDSGGRAEVAGVISYRMTVDLEAQNRWLVSQRWFPQDGAYDLSRLWTAGLIPTTILKPSWEFAQGYARVSMENLGEASPDELHIYVSHDHLIAALLYHWFGVSLYADGIRYLEGLLMQVCEGGLRAWLRGGDGVFDLPFWWPKLA